MRAVLAPLSSVSISAITIPRLFSDQCRASKQADISSISTAAVARRFSSVFHQLFVFFDIEIEIEIVIGAARRKRDFTLRFQLLGALQGLVGAHGKVADDEVGHA